MSFFESKEFLNYLKIRYRISDECSFCKKKGYLYFITKDELIYNCECGNKTPKKNTLKNQEIYHERLSLSIKIAVDNYGDLGYNKSNGLFYWYKSPCLVPLWESINLGIEQKTCNVLGGWFLSDNQKRDTVTRLDKECISATPQLVVRHKPCVNIYRKRARRS